MNFIDLLVQLDIALIAINLGVFALANSSIVNQVKHNSIIVNRRLNETNAEIGEMTQEGNPEAFAKIQQKIQEYNAQSDMISDKLYRLTLRGAVIVPNAFYVLGLLPCCIQGFFDMNIHLFMYSCELLAVLLIGLGVYKSFLTLQAIEFASKNVPLPDFDISWMGEDSVTISHGNENLLLLSVANIGTAIGEVIDFCAFFPDGFVIDNAEEFDISAQDDSSFLPNSTAIWIEMDYLHIDTSQTYEIKITPNIQPGTHNIPATINEKTITQQEFVLKIIVEGNNQVIPCPLCGGISPQTGKKWKFGQFDAIQYKCAECEKLFSGYYRNEVLSHTVPKSE